jgi:hypothetical protein
MVSEFDMTTGAWAEAPQPSNAPKAPPGSPRVEARLLAVAEAARTPPRSSLPPDLAWAPTDAFLSRQ